MRRWNGPTGSGTLAAAAAAAAAGSGGSVCLLEGRPCFVGRLVGRRVRGLAFFFFSLPADATREKHESNLPFAGRRNKKQCVRVAPRARARKEKQMKRQRGPTKKRKTALLIKQKTSSGRTRKLICGYIAPRRDFSLSEAAKTHHPNGSLKKMFVAPSAIPSSHAETKTRPIPRRRFKRQTSTHYRCPRARRRQHWRSHREQPCASAARPWWGSWHGRCRRAPRGCGSWSRG